MAAARVGALVSLVAGLAATVGVLPAVLVRPGASAAVNWVERTEVRGVREREAIE